MKKIFAFVLVAAMIFAFAVPAAAVTNITANKFTPVIDGVRDEAYGGPVDVAVPLADGNPNYATGKVWTAWNNNTLYFYAEIYDKTPQFGDSRNDDVEIYIDWNAGRGGENYATPETPFWIVKVQSDPDEYLSGLIMEDEGAFNWGAGSTFDEICEWFVGPYNGDFNNGYIVEIAIPAPDAAPLSEGKQIPFDFQISDNILGEGERDAQIWLEAGENEQWRNVSTFNGLITLGGEYVPPSDDEPEASDGGDAGGAEENKPVTPAKTGDGTVMLIVLAFALACAFTVTRKSRNKA